METMAATAPVSIAIAVPPPVFRLNSEILEAEEEAGEDYSYEDSPYGSFCSDRDGFSHSDVGLEDDSDDEDAHTVINVSTTGEGAQIQVRRGPIFDKNQDLPSRIIAMAEFMFSDEHLCRDGFLLKHLRHRQDGYISLKLIASLRKVKRVCKDFNTVAEALKGSEKLEISEDGTKIRRREPISPTLTVVKKPKKDGDQEDDERENTSPSKNGKNNSRKRSQKKGDKQFGSNGDLDLRRNSNPNPRSRSGSQTMYMNQNQNSLVLPGSFDEQIMPRRRVASFSNTVSNSRVNNKQQQNNHHNSNNHSRGHGNNNHFLSPNPVIAALSSEGGSDGFWRPKSNSYSEGSQGTKAGMSSWLEKRKASAASLKVSCGDLAQTEVIRQPRGPDGTNGFHPNCRTLNPAMFSLINRTVICPPPPLIMAN